MPRRPLPLACFALLSLLAGPRGSDAAEATRWAPAGITSPQFESHPAFDPLTGDLYFVRSSPQFVGWRILVSHCGTGGWTEPQPPTFAGPGVEADPFFTADGRTLYFISTRATGSTKSKDLDLWRVDRGADGSWGTPVRLPEPVNSPGAEWFPRPAPDGWLYFGSDRPGGLGGNDIWRARADSEGRWTAENLGAAINSAANEYEPLPSHDGRHLLVMADGGLFLSEHTSRDTAAGWSKSVKLGPEVNANGSEIGALWSPSDRTLLFARDTGAPDSGELFVWHREGTEDWPPSCPAVAASPADAPRSANADGVRAAEEGWSKAFLSVDSAFLDALLDPAYVSVGSKGNARTKAEVIALAVRYAAEHPGATATPLPPTSTIDVKGTAAVVTHHNPGETSVDVFYFADGRWRAWYSQHTAITPAP